MTRSWKCLYLWFMRGLLAVSVGLGLLALAGCGLLFRDPDPEPSPAANENNSPPAAVLEAWPQSGVAPLTVRFCASKSVDPDGGPLTVTWSFGDGTVANAVSPTHTFRTGGVYAVALVVEDQRGATAREQVTVEVQNATAPFFTDDSVTGAEGETQLRLGNQHVRVVLELEAALNSFSLSTQGELAGIIVRGYRVGEHIVVYAFDPLRRYAPGIVVIDMDEILAMSLRPQLEPITVTAFIGLVKLAGKLYAGKLIGAGMTKWLGASATQMAVYNTASYVGTGVGAILLADEIASSARVDVPGQYGVSATTPFIVHMSPDVARAVGIGHFDSHITVSGYGDPFVSSISDGLLGATGRDQSQLSVYLDPDGRIMPGTFSLHSLGPKVRASVSPSNEGETGTRFVLTGSHEAGGPIVHWEWDFDDGTSATGRTVAHTYATPGRYDVKVIGYDSQGLSASQRVEIKVSAGDGDEPQPDGRIVSHVVTPSAPTVGTEVTFRMMIENTGTDEHTFVAGLSVWEVGRSIWDSVIDTWQEVTVAAGEQEEVVLAAHSFSADEAGDWHYQFGLWEDHVQGTLLDKDPDPPGILTVSDGQTPTGPPDSPTPLEPGTSSAPGPIVDTLTPTFRWEEVANADRYAIGISDYPYGPERRFYSIDTLTGTSFTLPSGVLEHGKKYRWNMQAGNSEGWSEVSSVLYFQTATSPGEIVVRPGESLRSAVENAPEGAVIHLEAGVWEEYIVIRKNLTLRGQGPERTVLRAPEDSTRTMIQIGVRDLRPDVRVVIEQLAVVGTEHARVHGLNVVYGHASISNCDIRGNSIGVIVSGSASATLIECNVYGNASSGIDATGASVITIRDSDVYANGRSGIYFSGREASIMDCLVFENASYGILISGSGEAAISGCTIAANERGVLLAGVSQSEITDCTITENRRSGIWLRKSAHADISGCTITANESGGIHVTASAQAMVSGCTVSGNGFSGIRFSSGQATITDCTITGNKRGVYALGTADVVVAGSRVSDNMGFGFRLSQSVEITILNSEIDGNGGGIIASGSTQAALEGNRITRNRTWGITIIDGAGASRCDPRYDKFSGRISGRKNVIPCSGEPDENARGAFCPAELSFLVTEEGGELDRRD